MFEMDIQNIGNAVLSDNALERNNVLYVEPIDLMKETVQNNAFVDAGIRSEPNNMRGLFSEINYLAEDKDKFDGIISGYEQELQGVDNTLLDKNTREKAIMSLSNTKTKLNSDLANGELGMIHKRSLSFNNFQTAEYDKLNSLDEVEKNYVLNTEKNRLLNTNNKEDLYNATPVYEEIDFLNPVFENSLKVEFDEMIAAYDMDTKNRLARYTALEGNVGKEPYPNHNKYIMSTYFERRDLCCTYLNKKFGAVENAANKINQYNAAHGTNFKADEILTFDPETGQASIITQNGIEHPHGKHALAKFIEFTRKSMDIQYDPNTVRASGGNGKKEDEDKSVTDQVEVTTSVAAEAATIPNVIDALNGNNQKMSTQSAKDTLNYIATVAKTSDITKGHSSFLTTHNDYIPTFISRMYQNPKIAPFFNQALKTTDPVELAREISGAGLFNLQEFKPGLNYEHQKKLRNAYDPPIIYSTLNSLGDDFTYNDYLKRINELSTDPKFSTTDKMAEIEEYKRYPIELLKEIKRGGELIEDSETGCQVLMDSNGMILGFGYSKEQVFDGQIIKFKTPVNKDDYQLALSNTIASMAIASNMVAPNVPVETKGMGATVNLNNLDPINKENLKTKFDGTFDMRDWSVIYTEGGRDGTHLKYSALDYSFSLDDVTLVQAGFAGAPLSLKVKMKKQGENGAEEISEGVVYLTNKEKIAAYSSIFADTISGNMPKLKSFLGDPAAISIVNDFHNTNSFFSADGKPVTMENNSLLSNQNWHGVTKDVWYDPQDCTDYGLFFHNYVDQTIGIRQTVIDGKSKFNLVTKNNKTGEIEVVRDTAYDDITDAVSVLRNMGHAQLEDILQGGALNNPLRDAAANKFVEYYTGSLETKRTKVLNSYNYDWNKDNTRRAISSSYGEHSPIEKIMWHFQRTINKKYGVGEGKLNNNSFVGLMLGSTEVPDSIEAWNKQKMLANCNVVTQNYELLPDFDKQLKRDLNEGSILCVQIGDKLNMGFTVKSGDQWYIATFDEQRRGIIPIDQYLLKMRESPNTSKVSVVNLTTASKKEGAEGQWYNRYYY